METWHLDVLVIKRDYQGKQLGSKMLERCIKPYIAKNGGGIMTLMTNTERNCVFYKRNGFEEFHKTTLCGNGHEVDNWSFRIAVPPHSSNKVLSGA